MKIRAHKGGLAESMKTATDVDNDPAAVRGYLEQHGIVVDGPVESVWYTPDPRINWRDTHLITVNGIAAAFCDEPLKGPAPAAEICPGATCEKGDELA